MKVLFSFLISLLTISAFSQSTPLLPAYKRYPTVPSLQLLLADSTTKFTRENLPKNKPLLIMLFNPDCEHCQHEAEGIVANKEALKNTQIVLVTTYPIYRMNEFGEKYGLNKMDNVVLTKDPYYLLLSFFEMHNFPYLALYDKKGNLIQTFEGSVGIDKVLQAFASAE